MYQFWDCSICGWDHLHLCRIRTEMSWATLVGCAHDFSHGSGWSSTFHHLCWNSCQWNNIRVGKWCCQHIARTKCIIWRLTLWKGNSPRRASNRICWNYYASARFIGKETVSETSQTSLKLCLKPVWNRVWWNQFRLVQTQFNWLGSFANMFACVLRFSSSGQSGNYLNVDEFPVGPLVRQNLMNFIYYKLPNSKIHFLTIYDIIRFQYISWMFQWLGHIWLGPGIVAQRETCFLTTRRPQRSSGGHCLLGIDKISSSRDSFIIAPKMNILRPQWNFVITYMLHIAWLVNRT